MADSEVQNESQPAVDVDGDEDYFEIVKEEAADKIPADIDAAYNRIMQPWGENPQFPNLPEATPVVQRVAITLKNRGSSQVAEENRKAVAAFLYHLYSRKPTPTMK